MSQALINSEELPDLAGQDQTDQIRKELYAQIIKELTESGMEQAIKASIMSSDTFPTPMDWIVDQANKALKAFDAQFGEAVP